MSTISYFTNKSQAVEVEKTYQMKNEAVIDFTLLPCISGDVVQALDIPAGAIVTNVGISVLTAETGTVNVGDGSDIDGWDASVNIGSTGITLGDGAYASAGKVYSTADTIDLSINADLDTGKIAVFATYSIVENK